VRTSDPDVEVEETRLKLAAVLGAMERAVCETE
jgi:anthranilate/para-aminobenzoate synthase component I